MLITLKKISLINYFIMCNTYTCIAADERKNAQISILEVDQDNRPIINIFLYSLSKHDIKNKFRFIIDIGSAYSVLDYSISSEFFYDDSEVHLIKGATGASFLAPVVSIKRMAVMGMIRDEIMAARMDLKNSTVGVFQDNPVDGILGMSFLQGTRFTMDFSQKSLIWWGKSWPNGTKLPLTFQDQKVPMVTLTLEGKQGKCILDTGMTGGLTLPWDLRLPGKGKPVLTQGYSQAVEAADASGEIMDVTEVKAGAASWKNIEVIFHKEVGTLGTDIWSAGPACFDFINGQVTLATQNGTDLAIERNPKVALPLAWDRKRKPPSLSLPFVMAGSGLEGAGFQPKDEIVQVGTLKRLTRGAIQDLVAEGRPLRWVVLRDGKQVELQYPREGPKP